MMLELAAGNHYGNICHSRGVAGLALTEITYAPSLKLPRHTHEHACFCLVLHGTYSEIYPRKALACQPLSVLYRPAGEPHADHFDDGGGRCFVLEFDPHWQQRLRDSGAALEGPDTFHGGSIVWLLMRLYKETAHVDAAALLAIEGLALETIAAVSRRSMQRSQLTRPGWLEQAREILHTHFSASLSLADIAEAVGIHPVHLAREFHRYYCTTIGDYVRRLRIEQACHQLTVSDASLVEIALTSGFASQAHFSRTFKAVTGMTPSVFRQTARSR